MNPVVEMRRAHTRDAYGRALVELGRRNPNVVVLDADLSTSTKTAMFGKEFPERFFNVGITEQNMMSIAAGLATCGKTVFVSTFAVFATGRAFNQVRQSIAYTNLNVKIVATHGGISVGEDGASHHSIEDIALMRVLPNMTVVVPADAIETEQVIFAVAEKPGPVYVRLCRPPTPLIYEEGYKFRGQPLKYELGKAVLLEEGSDVTILATGILVYEALEAAALLRKKDISAEVVNVHTIKPLDEELVEKSARKTGAVVTAEDHSIIGGLGGAVAEFLCETYPVPMARVGVRDVFCDSGPWEELLAYYGLTASGIADAAQKVISSRGVVR